MSSTAKVLPFKIEDEASLSSRQKPQLSPSTQCALHEVRHAYFKWSIENFSCFPSADDQYIQSPIFELDVTWWYLSLHPKVKMCGRDIISLYLMRHKSDPGPQMVAVSYRLGLESGDNKVWFKPEERMIFMKGDVCAFQTSILGHLEDFLQQDFQNDKGILSVLCELYVFYEQGKATFEEIFHGIDPNLPFNLQRLFQSESRNDVLIETPKARARAHKCVLSARSKTLAKMLKDGSSVIHLNCTPSCLYCVFNYIYGGNLIFLTKNVVFSIGLYELACELSLSKLSDYLSPWRIELKSQILVEECSFAFAFHSLNVGNIQMGDIKSRFHVDKGTGIGIKLCLQEISSSDYVEFCVEVSGTTTALHFVFQLYILNESSDGICIVPAKSFKNPYVTYENFIAKYSVCFPLCDILNFSADGILYLNLSGKRYSLIHLSYHSLNNIEKPSNSSYLTWHQDLSTDMKALRSSAYLSDVTLVASPSGSLEEAHQSILATRSEYFRDIFDPNRDKNVKQTLIVKPNVLKLILLYIYSGSIPINEEQISIKDALDVYIASEKCKLQSLIKLLSRYLASNLEESFVLKALEIAQRHDNLYLIVECQKYIVEHELQKEETDEKRETDESTSGEDFWDDSDEESDEGSDEESGNDEGSDEESGNDEGSDEESGNDEGSDEESGNDEGSDEECDKDDGSDEECDKDDGSDEECDKDDGSDEESGKDEGSDEDSPNKNSSDDTLNRIRLYECLPGKGSSKVESLDKKSEKRSFPFESLSGEDLLDEKLSEKNSSDEKYTSDRNPLHEGSPEKNCPDKSPPEKGEFSKKQSLDEKSNKNLTARHSVSEGRANKRSSEDSSDENSSDENPSNQDASHRNCPVDIIAYKNLLR